MNRDSVEYCPECATNLQGEPIPEKSQEFFGYATHFSRKIGIYNMDRDRTEEYMCPDFGFRWDRFLDISKRPKKCA